MVGVLSLEVGVGRGWRVGLCASLVDRTTSISCYLSLEERSLVCRTVLMFVSSQALVTVLQLYVWDTCAHVCVCVCV